MKKFLSVLVATALVSVATQLPSHAEQPKKNYYVGVGATFFDGTTGVGLISKISVAENISIRPFVSILGSYGDTSLYLTGVSAMYDFKIPNSDFAPYGGVGYGVFGITDGLNSANIASSFYAEAGVDYATSDSLVVNGNYRFFRNGGAFSLGAGYQF